MALDASKWQFRPDRGIRYIGGVHGNAAICGVATARTGGDTIDTPEKVEPTEAPTRNLKSNPRILWR